jgi:hypothetical protein
VTSFALVSNVVLGQLVKMRLPESNLHTCPGRKMPFAEVPVPQREYLSWPKNAVHARSRCSAPIPPSDNPSGRACTIGFIHVRPIPLIKGWRNSLAEGVSQQLRPTRALLEECMEP